MLPDIQFRAHVLVIDDSNLDATILAEALRSLGCQVDITDDDGFAKKRDNNYDIAFVDINMPNTDGFSLVRFIRKSDLPTKHTPIIAVSANEFNKDQAEISLEHGLDGYLQKPVELSILKDLLSNCLPKHLRQVKTITSSKSDDVKGFYLQA
jgi:two-component system capsular synthesis sensor histidine kinase RcsC